MLDVPAYLESIGDARVHVYYQALISVLGGNVDTLLRKAEGSGFSFANTELGQALAAMARREVEAEIETRVEARVKAETKAEALTRQLSRRFGPLAGPTANRIRSANLEQLDRGLDAVVDAQKLSDVLAVF